MADSRMIKKPPSSYPLLWKTYVVLSRLEKSAQVGFNHHIKPLEHIHRNVEPRGIDHPSSSLRLTLIIRNIIKLVLLGKVSNIQSQAISAYDVKYSTPPAIASAREAPSGATTCCMEPGREHSGLD